MNLMEYLPFNAAWEQADIITNTFTIKLVENEHPLEAVARKADVTL